MEIHPILIRGNDKNPTTLNRLYEFFVEIWQDTWRELNVQALNFHDDFHRFHSKLGLFHGVRPIAFHGYGFFNLHYKADCEHSYFTKLKIPIVEHLKSKNLFQIATLEYMSVHPDFRRYANQNMGEVLGGVSTQYFKNQTIDAVLTVTRNNRSVNKMCQMYGAWPLYEKLPLHNVEVDIMVFEPKKIKPNPNAEIQSLIDDILNKMNPNRKKEYAAA